MLFLRILGGYRGLMWPAPVAYMLTPSLDYDIFTETGQRGWMGSWYSHESDESMTPVAEPLKTQYIDETRMFFR